MKNFNGLLLGAMVMVASTTSTLGATTVNKVQTQVQTQVQAKETAKEEVVKVIVTDTGKKFHKANCKTLKKSKIEIELKKAMLVYEPCKVCHKDAEARKLMEEIKALKAQFKEQLKEEQNKELASVEATVKAINANTK